VEFNYKRRDSMKTVAVYGLTAGTGKTSVAKEMAGLIHQFGQNTLLVDLDLNKGNITDKLGLNESPNIGSWLIETIKRMNTSPCWEITYKHEEIQTYIQQHNSGLHVLASNTEKNLDHSPLLLSSLEIILRSLLKSSFGVVVFDTNSEVRDYTIELILRVDKVLLVVEPFGFSLQNAEMFLRLLVDEGIRMDRFGLVFNRFPTYAEENPQEISKSLGIPLCGVLPNYPNLSGKKNQTKILTTKKSSRFSQELHQVLKKVWDD